MNRVVCSFLEAGTSVNLHEVACLQQPSHLSKGFVTEKFPVYPLYFELYLENPPFNKISISFEKNFMPKQFKIYGSENGKQYNEILSHIDDDHIDFLHIFKTKMEFNYLQIVFDQPKDNENNLCKQIRIRGMQICVVNFYRTDYACSLTSKLTIHPDLFRLLEILQYKYLLVKQNETRLFQKYLKRLEELKEFMIDNKKQTIYPTQQDIFHWKKQVELLEQQPLYNNVQPDYPDPQATKDAIFRLQRQLKKNMIDRLSSIKKHVEDYFGKYKNVEIRQSYLRLLSSPEEEDQNKALINFWTEIKEIQLNDSSEQAAIMFLNYYLQFLQSPFNISALKVLILFLKTRASGNHTIFESYQRVLFNLIKKIHLKEDDELYKLSLKSCYLMYDHISNEIFIQRLLEDYKSYNKDQQMEKLTILEKLTFRNLNVVFREPIIAFLLDMLQIKQLTLVQKNKAYNIAAYLASIFGKQLILRDFEKLNSMILMSMEGIINQKLPKIGKQQTLANKSLTMEKQDCEYCGAHNPKFKDQNLYDLHIAKSCKMFTSCEYCGDNVEISQLFRHYDNQCKSKNQFTNCEQCFDPILKNDKTHHKKCLKKMCSKCPLCYQKLENKLKIREHLSKNQCPNNTR